MAILPLQLARVSNQLRSNLSSQQITRTQKQLLDVQNELTTGKRLNAPSDDPGDSAIVQQLRKTLEQRAGFLDNLQQAGSHLSEVDSTLSDLTNLLQQAQDIASANVGSDVTAEERTSASTVIESLYSQILNVANKQFEGMYIFAGDRLTEAPFVPEGGGVKFVGSTRVLANQFDEGTTRTFMVNGDDVFGALSTRIEGTADLTPSIDASTRLADLGGATADGIRLGSIQLSNGTDTAVVDLSTADTVGDVIDAINAAGVGGISASIGADGMSLALAGSGGDDITMKEVGGGRTASDLGILVNVGGGAGAPVAGANLKPRVTLLTPLANLRAGAGIDLASGITITNGLQIATVDFSAATTVQDMLNALNGSGTAVRAEINASGTGINILNPTQGTQMKIAENGGTTATDLGVRSFAPTTLLSELNLGKGVRTVDGDDLLITDSAGTSFSIDLSGATTVQDVIDAINTATGGTTVTASFATTGNGIVLTDTAGAGGTLDVTSLNYSSAAKDLGLLETPAAGGVITGADVDPVKAAGVFSNVARLREALQASDQAGITEAAEGLREDLARITRVRGQTGARVQELESRQERLTDQNIATQALLSNLEDTDFTSAITRFQTLQTALQASMQTSSRLLNLSLMDFLG